MYEDAIECLEDLARQYGNGDQIGRASCLAAVSILCAAQPKDAEAERAYCVQAIYSAPMEVYQRERWLLEQRAAARAETAAEVERLRRKVELLRGALLQVRNISGDGWVEGSDDSVTIICVQALEASK